MWIMMVAQLHWLMEQTLLEVVGKRMHVSTTILLLLAAVTTTTNTMFVISITDTDVIHNFVDAMNALWHGKC